MSADSEPACSSTRSSCSFARSSIAETRGAPHRGPWSSMPLRSRRAPVANSGADRVRKLRFETGCGSSRLCTSFRSALPVSRSR